MDEVTKYALNEIHFYGKTHYGESPTRLMCSPDKYSDLRTSKDSHQYIEILKDGRKTFMGLEIVIDHKTPGIRAE